MDVRRIIIIGVIVVLAAAGRDCPAAAPGGGLHLPGDNSRRVAEYGVIEIIFSTGGCTGKA